MCSQFIHYRQLKKKVQPSEELPASKSTLSHRFDEFYLSQTFKSTILRAARLEKAHKMMDYVEPVQELISINLKSAALMESHQSIPVNFTQVRYSHLRYRVKSVSYNLKAFIALIESVRNRATIIRQEMESFSSTEAQEDFLMRHFIVDCLCESHQRATATKYFLRDYDTNRTTSVIVQEYSCVILLPLALAVMAYFVYRFNLLIGSRATNLWVLVTCLVIVQDLLVLQPLKILLNWWIITKSVAADARELVERLCLRSKLVMMRTTGLMRDADALVQHFNPACRVARMYPQLPISRLLMSINDFDIPERKQFSWW
jgi:hypothetical protein